MEINLKNVKGKGTKDTGITIIIVSILLFITLEIAAVSISSDYFSSESEKATANILSNLAPNLLVLGVLVGIIINALGQIVINTGTTAKIQEELAKQDGHTIKF
ncbi:hypothetical protein [Flavicella sediminum]|uniref:hypothetical protein n=1 Tax=Flavicella sediminum TaxID=2585141 RepID=UPI00111FA5A2|nr:hypothetical protein [Flavicella sediminum]